MHSCHEPFTDKNGSSHLSRMNLLVPVTQHVQISNTFSLYWFEPTIWCERKLLCHMHGHRSFSGAGRASRFRLHGASCVDVWYKACKLILGGVMGTWSIAVVRSWSDGGSMSLKSVFVGTIRACKWFLDSLQGTESSM